MDRPALIERWEPNFSENESDISSKFVNLKYTSFETSNTQRMVDESCLVLGTVWLRWCDIPCESLLWTYFCPHNFQSDWEDIQCKILSATWTDTQCSLISKLCLLSSISSCISFDHNYDLVNKVWELRTQKWLDTIPSIFRRLKRMGPSSIEPVVSPPDKRPRRTNFPSLAKDCILGVQYDCPTMSRMKSTPDPCVVWSIWQAHAIKK